MNLYLVSQNENKGYDTYDSFVACCEDEESARHMRPGDGGIMTDSNWAETYSVWASNPAQVEVKLIGAAGAEVARGVVCASFNAG